MKHALVALLLFTSFASGQTAPYVKIPQELKAKPGRLLRIQADSNGKIVRWLCASEDADIISINLDGRNAIFSSPVAGRFQVFAYTALADVPSEPATCIVIVGDPKPPVPPPDPKPPEPPTPDLLQALVQTAYNVDPDPAKAVNCPRLAFLYRDATRTTCKDPSVTTWGQLFSTIQTARKGLMQDGLANVRLALGKGLFDQKWPTDANAPIDRVLAQETLILAAKVLEGIK